MPQITTYDLQTARELYKLHKKGIKVKVPQLSTRIPPKVVEELARYCALLQFLGEINMKGENQEC